jgi:hypothetical protein
MIVVDQLPPPPPHCANSLGNSRVCAHGSRRLHYFSTPASSLAPGAVAFERILRHFEEPRRSDRNKRGMRGEFPAASSAFAHPNTNLDTIHTNRLALHMEVLCEPTSTSMMT